MNGSSDFHTTDQTRSLSPPLPLLSNYFSTWRQALREKLSILFRARERIILSRFRKVGVTIFVRQPFLQWLLLSKASLFYRFSLLDKTFVCYVNYAKARSHARSLYIHHMKSNAVSVLEKCYEQTMNNEELSRAHEFKQAEISAIKVFYRWKKLVYVS
ncbi:hypothetical protein GEMRC1_008565 [Eukaryota sp. GEM-RC1]